MPCDREGDKSEIRKPKFETNPNDQKRKSKTQAGTKLFWAFVFLCLGLFRISCFGFRIFARQMIVGSLRVRMLVRQARTLKDKRRVTRGILDRLRNSFNVSVAEIEARDHRQLLVFGIAMVGTDGRQVTGSLDRIVDALRVHPEAELLDYERGEW
jgi:uncharacterized protein YlxP (DUF503 family)